MKKILIFLLIFCTLYNLQSYSQDIKRTNIWYFGRYAGVDFNSGEPVALYNGKLDDPTLRGNTTMSDTNGNLLFYTNGWHLWNRNHNYMPYQFFHRSYQVVSFPVPGSDHLYYAFSVPYYNPPANYYLTSYAIIDMTMNGGLGGVSGDIITLDAAWDASEKITAVKHKNKQDVWVITRKYTEDKYASFLVTQDSVNTTPVLSPAPELDPSWYDREGQMKISYDKEYMINCMKGIGGYPGSPWGIEVCKFNDVSGEVDYLYSFQFEDPNYQYSLWSYGVEFSPDSKFLYITFNFTNSKADSGSIYQFNAQYIEDSAFFVQSAVRIGVGKKRHGLQLASDGKIYVTGHPYPLTNPYLGVIHKPWEQGMDCQYENEGVFLEPGKTTAALPNFLLDYLYRFDFEGHCETDPFQFTPFFNPYPANIIWNFGDPGSGMANNISNELYPTHVFSDGGIFEVCVHVEYPNGRIELTSRKVEVEYAPEPNLGPDTTICSGQEVVLNAECGTHFYSWSTGQSGVSQITVSDTGWYWVRVTSNAGCFEIDSIYISFYPHAIADTNNLVISPTTCGGSIGAIRGLAVSGNPPFIYQWVDDLGNPIANTLDIFHLPVGNYTLQVTDGNDCLTEFGPYTIYDAGDVLIQEVNYTQEHCGQQDGSIIVTAISGLSDMLFYSIDNGVNYFSNQGVFTSLSAGTYAVRVQDSTQCEDVFINNPIILENIPGPQITDIQITSASGGLNNGAIHIFASGNGDTLFYSNDNGANFQINDGLFTDLFPGYYTCIVMDEYGCDTTFIVEVTEDITIHLEAIAGDDEVCPGNAAYVPLIVNQFNDVATFRATLMFNKNLLECQGFANAHPQLEDSLNALLFPAEGRIELNWSSPSVTLPDGSILADLVFSSLNPGISQVEWDGEPGASFFLNPEAQQIPVDYYVGNVKIYKEVTLSLNSIVEACQGKNVLLAPTVLSSNGPVTYLWTDPSGDTSSYFIKRIDSIQPYQAGTYYLTVIDTANCQADTSVVVIVYPTPIPAFAGQDTIFTEVPVDIDAGAGFLYYLWNTGDSTQIIMVQNNGWYAVEIESQQGCLGGDSVFVLFSTPPEPIPDIKIYLPNAFSPNEDGLNDEFKAVTNSENIESFQILIFDRWGTLIFQSNNISFGWNGTFKGNVCPQGVYVYKIEYSLSASSTGQSETKIGTVVLIR